jgi:Rod binding domain-containing protein
VDQPQARMFVFDAGVDLNDIVRAVNQVGAAQATWSPFSKALKESGALRAELICHLRMTHGTRRSMRNPMPALTRERVAQAPKRTTFASSRRCAAAPMNKDPRTLREVARQFESIFTKMMLDSMREASFGDSPARQRLRPTCTRDMVDDPARGALSQGKGLGLADMLVRQLGQARRRSSGRGAAGDSKVQPEQQRQVHRRKCCRMPRRPRANSAWTRAPSSLRPRWKPDGALAAVRMAAAPVTISLASRPALPGNGASVASPTTEYVDGVARDEQARFSRLRVHSRKT